MPLAAKKTPVQKDTRLARIQHHKPPLSREVSLFRLEQLGGHSGCLARAKFTVAEQRWTCTSFPTFILGYAPKEPRTASLQVL
jgi:hypothetical protein